MECCCHFNATKSQKLQQLSAQTAQKLKHCAEQWRELNKEPETSMCNSLDIESLGDSNVNTQYIHHSCYARLINKSKLEMAKKSFDKAINQHDDDEQQPPPAKKLRSQTRVKQASTKPVLMPVCVICSKADKLVYQKTSGTNKRQPLMKAATLTAGRLRDAATHKGDEKILVHLMTDPVASEMRYHKKCYLDYVRDMYGSNSTASNVTGTSSTGVDDEFCNDVVLPRLIENKEYISLKNLLTIHLNYSDSITRTDQLKKSLQKRYPDQLFFDRPKNRNESELVYSKEASFTDLVGEVVGTMATESSDDSELEDHEPFHIAPCVNEVYHSSMLIRKSIDDHDYTSIWPPTAETLTLQHAKTSVPALLYNALAVIAGVSEDIPNNVDFISDIDNGIHCKLLSISQDVVNLRNKGRNPTPKALSLGMSLKHLTGSANILKLMGSFGHCSSYDTVNRMETAIALNHIGNPQHIPNGFQTGQPTVLVFDNIDFCEETLSGSGSTHHVNGIMFQAVTQNTPLTHNQQLHSTPTSMREHSSPISGPQLQSPSTSRQHQLSKRPRSVNPPALIIEPFILGLRKGTRITSETLNQTYETKRALISQPILHEFSYLAIKKETTTPKPGWTGFNKSNTKAESLLPKSNLHYLNVIESSPNDIATISHVLNLSVEKADHFQLECITVIFDQALYSKAQHIRWKNPTFQERLVVRMGEFHTCMAFLGSIGKMYKLSGFEDLLIESEVLATGSANGVVSGHMYNRSIRCHKILYEALGRLQIEAFLEQADDKTKSEYFEAVDQMLTCTTDFDPFVLRAVFEQFSVFILDRCKHSPTFAFWNNYLNMVRMLLMFVRATRESNWSLHLDTLRQMLPYFFALDRQNYARYGSVYWAEMEALSTTHPSLHKTLSERGSWTLQRSDLEPFCSIAGDQGIEQTVNRDAKTSGGLKGRTLSRASVQKWYLTQSERAAICRECETMAGINPNTTIVKEIGPKRMKLDEDAVRQVMNAVNNFVNPWTYSGESLVSLISGVVAPVKTESDLINALDNGEKNVQEFIRTRITTEETDFFAPIKANKLHTFSTVQRKKSSQQAKADIHIQDRSLFARLLVISRSREIDLKEILKYPLSSVSLPLSTADGQMAKNVKSQLLEAIEKDCKDHILDGIGDDPCAIMIDGMALIQSLSPGAIPQTFKQLAELILKSLVSYASKYNADRVDFVIDTYPQKSIKQSERSRRSSTKQAAPVVHIVNGDVKVPHKWKAFLSSNSNKRSLLAFLNTHWPTCDCKKKLSLFSTTDTQCIEIKFNPGQRNVTQTVTCLTADHEEADTRLLLHALHASQCGYAVIITSPDTDVTVISIGLSSKFENQLAVLTGVKEKRRLLDVKAIAMQLGPDIAEGLIGLHAFTGCDAVSSFTGKGKRTVYQLMKKKGCLTDAMKGIGQSYEVSDELLKLCERFICQLYGDTGDDINVARYKIFCSRAGASTAMPPCRASLYQHLCRANYVAGIWRRATVAKTNPPCPTLSGWLDEDESYSFLWHEGEVAPPAILKTIFCGCKKSKCQAGRCSCKDAKLSCTELCKCVDCENDGDSDHDEEMDNAEDDSEEDIDE